MFLRKENWISFKVSESSKEKVVLQLRIIGEALADTVSYDKIKIKPGDIVPDFNAQDENLKFRKLSELRGKKNLILVFFRGYW